MNKKIKFLPVFAFLFLMLQCNNPGHKKTPVDYVNPYIGTINPKTRGLTPIIKVPGGTVGLFPTVGVSPSVALATQDMYLDDKIFGFPLGFGNLMINTGVVKTETRENASKFDHDLETATPYYYQALLEDPDINAEFTVTNNTVLFRFTLPENKTSNLLLNLIGNDTVEIINNNIIEGSSSSNNRNTFSNNRNRRYFYAELSKPIKSFGTWQNGTITPETRIKAGNAMGVYVSYQATHIETLEIKIGISSNSVDEARGFLASEVGSMSFDKIKEKAKELWNNELNLIKVKGGTEKQLTIFYTSLYRTRSVRMGNVWDTYRCAYPLQTLIKPEETLKAIQGFVKTYEETGWLPSSGAMIGNHSTAVIVDAYMKGLRDFNVGKAYEGMKKNAMEATMIPWKDAGHITELEQ
jgi:putative alpha-1,2-mannosidase